MTKRFYPKYIFFTSDPKYWIKDNMINLTSEPNNWVTNDIFTLDIQNAFMTIRIFLTSDPNDWVIKPFHDCAYNDHLSIVHALNMEDCMNGCYPVPKCWGVVFVPTRLNVANCFLKTVCHPTPSHRTAIYHAALLGMTATSWFGLNIFYSYILVHEWGWVQQ